MGTPKSEVIGMIPANGLDFKKVETFSFIQAGTGMFQFQVVLKVEGMCSEKEMDSFIELWAIARGRKLK